MKNKYDLLQLVFWALIIAAGIYLANVYTGKITDPQEKFKLLANFGMMITPLGGAFFLYFLGKLAGVQDKQGK